MAKELHIRIDSHIGIIEDAYGYMYPGFTALELEWRLMELPNPETLILHLGTEGGDVWEGLKILARIEELKQQGTIVEVIIESICYSMGTVLAMTASPGRLKARATAMWSVHKPLASVYGNADDLRKRADELDSHETALTSAYISRTGKPLAEIQAELRKDIIISAQEAKEQGWIDEIINTPSLVANSKATAFKPIAFVRAEQPQINQTTDTKMAENKKPGLWAKIKALLEEEGEDTGIVATEDNKVVAVSKTLKDGSSIYYDGELASGTAVFSDAELTTPLADGSYELENGDTVVVAGGTVSEITEATDATATALAEKDQEIQNLKDQLAATASKEIEITNLRAEKADLETKIAALKKTVPGGGDNTPTPPQNFKGTGGATTNSKETAFNNAAERFKQKYNKQ